ncbi:hypothetical protein KUTeg_024464 [Tegillarca granosa]|uniref:CAP-Gly domain-containing protein n=1 Tax=Tegillarca granosa TaxID=220873 RepID=A0ABQ9DXF2_TEGGR|nr:hypothetical protein KUTeg_024464 [Tegillarca granosa]
MAYETSQSDSKFSGKDGRKEKRRSFLPAPLKVQKPQNIEEQYSKTDYPPDLVVGDRVLISGVKSGILLYHGKTHIAPGIWCGIALDDPDGKHDGKVEGVRYFNCFPGHGIFAPVEKVEKITPENIYEQKGIDEHYSPERTGYTHRHSKPARRLLPQPKVFTRVDSKEKITVPSKIDEQNEEIEEYLMVEKIERRQLPEKPPSTGLSQFGFKPLSHRQYDITDNKQVQQENTKCVDSNLDHKNILSETFVIKQGFNLNELESQIKQSKLTKSTTELSAPGSDDSTKFVDSKSLQINDLNRTYEIKNDSQTETKASPSMTDSASSNEDSLSTDFKERLLADRPEYFNITFDTENGGSPPQNLPNVNVSPAKTSDVKQTPPSGVKPGGNDSSLGVLNLDQVDTELIQNVFESSANLTDSEKLLHTVVLKPRNAGRIASVGDTFDISGAVTSSPLVEGLNRKSEQQPIENEFVESNKLCELTENDDIKRNLNSTFKVDQSKPIEIIGDDTLDWRQEASDGEEPDEISDNSTDTNIETCKEEEKVTDVIINKNQTVELLQKPKKAMVDSGISEMGDINNLEHGRMTDSVDSLRRSQNLEEMISSADSNFYEGDQKQLEADLKAGLLNKKDRPLSLISADTGYVPDTDSEFGTVTNSPLDWAEKQGLSQNITRTELDEAYSNTFKHFQAAVMKGTTRATSQALDYDSDICSDGGTILADTDTEKEESADLENLSSAVIHDIKGLSAEEVLPENTAKMIEAQVKTPTNPEMFLFPNQEDNTKDEQQSDKVEESVTQSEDKNEVVDKEADTKTVSDNEKTGKQK